jgi:tripartite ATP-independent transporter DctP family solute receptor
VKKEVLEMVKNILSIRLLLIVLIMGVLLINGNIDQVAGQEKITLKFPLITSEKFPYYDGAAKFKELIESRSKGQVEVKIYPGGQLGGSRDIFEGILEGALHMAVGDAVLGNMAPVYNVFSLPFLINGADHMVRIVKGPIGEQLAKRIESEGGFRVLGWFSTGSAAIETREKPVVKVDDLKGLKIRVMEVPMLVDTLRALGANPTPMPYTEVYMGLKQGVIDGCLVNLVSVTTLKLQEVVKFITDYRKSPFSSSARPIVMKVDFFESLPKDIQKLIRECMLEAAEHERSVFVAREQKAMGKLKKEGITFTELDFSTFEPKLAPVYEKWTEKLKIEDIMKQIQAIR